MRLVYSKGRSDEAFCGHWALLMARCILPFCRRWSGPRKGVDCGVEVAFPETEGGLTGPPRYIPVRPFDRHRGGGRPPTPATPPCVRVRTRRFESVTLTFLEQ